MPAPSPPVALKDHCSILHDGVLYVYSPDAFQILQLTEGAQWQEEQNGISVVGATCVKGGIDGDNTKPALYVVGGVANDSSSTYPGLQRYSILDRAWQTITPVVPVTQHRQYHGTAYMNASSAIVVYGGSQNGDTGLSSETFLLEMYPPYQVQAYSSSAPPVIQPFMLSWSEDRALMVGGSSTNVNIFTFGPADGWQDLGLALPNALPDPSGAQCALLTLDDGSKILQTFELDQSPNTVTTHVLLNPGGLAASFGETAGGSATTASPSSVSTAGGSRTKKSLILSNYPTYNESSAPTTTRTGFSLAQDDNNGLVSFVGGDAADSVGFFNQTGDTWIAATQLLGDQPAPSSTTSGVNPTSTVTGTPTSSASSGSSHKSHGLTVLGAVLGGICGAAAILIVLLLWLRSLHKKRAQAEKKNGQTDYGDDKRKSGDFEERGLQPLSQAGQPMGRSPVPSTLIPQADSTAMFGGARPVEKGLIRRVSSDASNRARPDGHGGGGMGFGHGLFKRDKSPLMISKPMMPDLGDYLERPAIELGKATPSVAVVPTAAAPARNPSQRKTDDGWGKYFQGDGVGANRTTDTSRSSSSTNPGNTGLWPGSGVKDSSTRSPKIVLRDSIGNALEAQTVAAGSPSLEHGPANADSRALQVAQGLQVRISSASSVSTAATSDGMREDEDDTDDYEDEKVDAAFSSGIPASIHETPWTPVGNTWSGPLQRPLRPPSAGVGAHGFPPPPTTKPTTTTTSLSSSSGGSSWSNDAGDMPGAKKSSIPTFPMPNFSIRPIKPSGGSNVPMGLENLQPPAATTRQGSGPDRPREEAGGYSGRPPARSSTPDNSDMSWLNLGTPTR